MQERAASQAQIASESVLSAGFLLSWSTTMRWVIAVLAGIAAGSSLPAVAQAHSGGVAGGGCGCHGGGEVGLGVGVSPTSFDPGDQITVTVTVAQPGANEAGLFVSDDDVGVFEAIGGQGMAVVPAGMTHTSPKVMSGGSAQFSFQWTAPDEEGAVRFSVWGVSANGNNSSSGDDADLAAFDFVYGCEGQEFYFDGDADGFGRADTPLLHCAGAPPPGYAAEPGDCNDNDDDQFPGAVEYCNQIDDDCDGETDENALPVQLYPDGDGDGYYGQREFESGDTLLGCVPMDGWAAEPGDCRPDDPLVNPGAEEVCNLLDDDCDLDVNEHVKPTCGEGWCRRESLDCNPDNCTPGEPREELCNFFDDDCDGVVDNDAECPAGESCQAGECRPVDDPGGAETGDDSNGGADGTDGPDTDGGPSTNGSGGPALDGTDGTNGGPGADGTDGGPGADGDASGCACRTGGGRDPWLLALVMLALRRRRRARRAD